MVVEVGQSDLLLDDGPRKVLDKEFEVFAAPLPMYGTMRDKLKIAQ